MKYLSINYNNFISIGSMKMLSVTMAYLAKETEDDILEVQDSGLTGVIEFLMICFILTMRNLYCGGERLARVG